jgi:hypothetical protein
MLNPYVGAALLLLVIIVYSIKQGADSSKRFFCTNCEYIGTAKPAKRPTGVFLLTGPFGFLFVKTRTCPSCKERGTLIPADSNRAKGVIGKKTE